MRSFMILGFILVISPCFSQIDTITDLRDGKSYRTVNINGATWMMDNLDLETSLSDSFEEMKKYTLTGRYYHMSELDSICPAGWRLPDVQDWVSYFKFLAEKEMPGGKLDISLIDDPVHYTISGYEEKIDVFNNGNPLNLKPTGRVEGKIFNLPNNYADYWTFDEKEEVEGRTHIHIMNPWTTIHSHKHHLKPNQKNKLRKFMVRCVTTN